VRQQKIAGGAHGKGEETPLKDAGRPNVKLNFEKEKNAKMADRRNRRNGQSK
jgi:hypothetical protein